MVRKLGLLFSFVALSGCAAVYPKQNANLLQTPIPFKYQHVSEPTLSKEDALAKVQASLQNSGLLTDKFVAHAVEKKASSEYDEILRGQPSDEIKFISNNLTGIFNENKILVSKYGTPHFSSRQAGFNLLPDNRFELKIRSESGNFYYIISSPPGFTGKATFDATITGDFAVRDGVVSGSISKIGYVLNCDQVLDSGRGIPNVVDVVLADEPAIINSVQKLSAFTKRQEIDVVSDLVKRMNRMISNRYRTSSGGTLPTTEKKYKVDFATAKARLQRALGEFKYDNTKSAFTFDKQFSKNNLTVTHKFSISLFPDVNDTVVQFSGDYTYLSDALDGPEIFGSSVYNEQMNKYVEKIGALLH